MSGKRAVLLSLILISGRGLAQENTDKGILWGSFKVLPEISGSIAHDSRALQTGNEALSDQYGELAGGIRIENLPAKYKVAAAADYGYRVYSEFDEINDDFYGLSALIKKESAPLLIGLITDLSKDLDYRTDYTPESGSDRVLTDAPNIRWLTEFKIAYDQGLTERLSVMPGYSFENYYQRLTDTAETEVAEWQVHKGILDLRHRLSDKTVLILGSSYSAQVNRDDNGQIASVYLGGEGQFTDKSGWRAILGVSAADYEESGSDVGGISDLRLSWDATEKIDTYAFAGNDFQPGYDGGAARMVLRAGYGLDWKCTRNGVLGGSGLHSYEEELGSAGSDDEDFIHLLNIGYSHRVKKNIVISINGSYVHDEIETDKIVAQLKFEYAY